MSDPKVLDAQQWVNRTYGTLVGYARCPEDGKTGWSTMYALTMGLQHELGISPVVASFGPSTLAKLQALGDIGVGWTKNRKIVEILQRALFCKGYWGCDPGTEGTFTAVTGDSVGRLRSDMGVGGSGTVNASIARCILNMDAYVVVAGGTDKIRGIQQWLNSRYWKKDAYTIGPCDGIYSRDVQKALVIAIQYELGLAPNGNFGPGTQTGLAAHTLKVGSSGIFVQLFSAACVFNEPVGIYRTSQRSTYDTALGDFVKAFQGFSQLAISGNGDYPTWAQLLVSMGDADRPATASDTRFQITSSRASWMYAHGYRAVGRYLYDPPGSTLDKEIKPGELATIFKAGLRVFPIYQDNARKLSDFTYSAGYQHALNAHKLAAGFGFDKGTVIYFAVDYDATAAEIAAAIVPYFRGVAGGLASQGKRYIHGVYGSRNVCANVTNETLARFSFVSGMSWGFSGNLGFPLPTNWSFNQIKETTVTNGSDTFDLDRDVWRSGSDPATRSVDSTAGPADAFIAYIQKLYDLAVAYGGSRSPSQLVMEYLRHVEYGSKDLLNKLGWWYLIGDFDSGFVDYVTARGTTIMKTFKDPFTGYEIGVEHLMATANGHLVKPQAADARSANAGDIAGWGGDLMTFYSEWQTGPEQYASGKTFCDARLAKPGVSSSFGFADLVEDADGYLVARAVKSGKTIVDAIKVHYNGSGGLRRFNDYFNARWTTADTCKRAAHNVLTATDVTLDLARKQLIRLSGAMLPAILINAPGGAAKLDGFEQGFVDAITARRGAEAKKVATYEANQRRYLQQAERRR